MAPRRSIALGTLLLVALAATALLSVFVLGDRSTDPDAPDADVVEAAAPARPPEAAPSLEGRSDARPLKAASLEFLLADLGKGDAEAHDAVVVELRERVRADALLIQGLIDRLDTIEQMDAAFRALTALGAPAARPLAAWGLRKNDAWCRRVLGMLQRMGPEAAPAVDLLLERLPREESGYVRRALFDVLAAVGPAARQAVPLLTAYLRPPLDDAIVRDAAVTLAAIDGENPATFEVYRAALLDEETRARPGVLEAVGSLGSAASTLIPLVIELLQDPEDATRYQAAATLGAIGGSSNRTIDALVSMLEHDNQYGQRAAAAALVALGPAGARALVRVASKVEDIDVRLSAAQVLMGVEGHGEACVQVLLSVLQEDCDKGWKSRALHFLARLDPPPEAERVLPVILQALEDPTLAKDACQALANVPGTEAHAALVAVLGREDEPELGSAGLDALLRSLAEDPARDDLLASLLKPDTPAALVKATLMRLRNLRPPGRAPVLLPALEAWLVSEDAELRAFAYQSLGRLTGDEGVLVDRLLGGLGDPETVWASASGLQNFPKHASRTVPALVEALLALPEDSSYRFNVFWAPALLARSWSGARACVERRRETASEAQQKTLDELLSKMR